MKLTLSQYGTTYSVEADTDELTIGELVELLFRPVVLAAGWSPGVVNGQIGVEDERTLDAYYQRKADVE